MKSEKTKEKETYKWEGKLYKDCSKDYKENLEKWLQTAEDKYYKEIFIDFKTYCFNRIRKLRPFLKVWVIDDWATEVTCNALRTIRRKGMNERSSWPENMAGYLSFFCLAINNKEHFTSDGCIANSVSLNEIIENKEAIEENEKPKGDVWMNIADKGNIDADAASWLIQEAVKMTVYNDGYKMVDVDRAMRLLVKHAGKIGRFRKKNTDIINAVKKNMESILAGNVVKGE